MNFVDTLAYPSQLETIVSLAGDAIISIDNAHRIVLFNREAERMFGYTAAEVMGSPVEVLLPDGVRRTHRAHVRNFAASGTVARYMGERQLVEGRRRNGDLFPADISISRVQVGETTVLTAVIRDATERHRAEALLRGILARERDARTLAERATARAHFLARASAAIDASLDYDSTLTALAGACAPALGAICIVDVVEEQAVRRVPIAHDPHDASGPAHLAATLGEIRTGATASPLTLSTIETACGTLISEIRDADLQLLARDAVDLEALRALAPSCAMVAPITVRETVLGTLTLIGAASGGDLTSDDLRSSIQLAGRAGLAIENARLYRRALNATRARDEVLAIVSHDLRNPLSTISMALSSLEELPDPTGERRVGLLRIARNSLAWSERLVRDLLDVASIDAGRLSIERGRERVGAILARAQSLFAERCQTLKVELLLDVPDELPGIHADGERILQVVGNLLSNAVKFSPANGRIVVSAKQRGDEVVVSVNNSGPPIPAASLPHVFERFWHADGGSRARGTGLGLTIAKGIVEAHGGRIWVETSGAEGTTFSFSVPLAT